MFDKPPKAKNSKLISKHIRYSIFSIFNLLFILKVGHTLHKSKIFFKHKI